MGIEIKIQVQLRHVKNLVNLQNASSISEISQLMNLAMGSKKSSHIMRISDVDGPICGSYTIKLYLVQIYGHKKWNGEVMANQSDIQPWISHS